MFRFATWACVSSDEQSRPEKASIPNQIEQGREFGTRYGGTESHPPFIADGFSRSWLEGLGEAMQKIPPLSDAMKAAEQNLFDVLICYYFERFGSVAYPVFIRLGRMAKQLRSVNEQTPIVAPDLYDFTRDEATSMMIHMSGVKQDYRINRIVNNLKFAMPKRIASGLTPGRIPYGYIYTTNKTPPEQDAGRIAKLLQARDMLLAGESLSAIGAFLGVDRTRVAAVLSNPFYVGTVAYNKTVKKQDGMRRVVVPQQSSKWTTGEGKHAAIWTRQEHEDIVAELARREGKYRPSDFIFSGILTCGVCGERARWHIFGTPPKTRRVVTCRKYYSSHILFEYDEFMDKAVAAVQDEIRKAQGGGVEKDTDNREELYRKAVADKQKKRRKVQEGYEADLYTAAEAGKLLRDLEQEIEQLGRDIERVQRERLARQSAMNSMEQLGVAANAFPEWVKNNAPERVNRLLAALILKIVLQPDGKVEVALR